VAHSAGVRSINRSRDTTLVRRGCGDVAVLPPGVHSQTLPRDDRQTIRLGKNAEMVVLTGITHHETGRYVEGLRRAVPWLKELWK
jgi:hypothetical protein